MCDLLTGERESKDKCKNDEKDKDVSPKRNSLTTLQAAIIPTLSKYREGEFQFNGLFLMSIVKTTEDNYDDYE